MSEPSIEQRVNEIDADVTDALNRALNGHWASTAIACALLDKGVISKVDLLKMIDSLILTASSYAVTAEADPHSATEGLERFRRDLEQLDLKPGQVLDELRELERLSAREAGRYQKMLRRDHPSGEDPGSSSTE